MAAQINLIRAIGTEFVARKFKSAVLIFGTLALIILLGVLWLTTISAWWWLLAVPFIGFMLLGIVICVAIRVLISAFRPQLTKAQASGVAEFVDKLERASDNLQTPTFIIVYRVIRDIVRPREKTFIQTVTEDSTTLHKDLLRLQRNFK